jgi:hypothetical protein
LRGEESVVDGVGRAEQRMGVGEGLDRDWKYDAGAGVDSATYAQNRSAITFRINAL